MLSLLAMVIIIAFHILNSSLILCVDVTRFLNGKMVFEILGRTILGNRKDILDDLPRYNAATNATYACSCYKGWQSDCTENAMVAHSALV